MTDDENANDKTNLPAPKRPRRREAIRRWGFSVTEAAKALGSRADALRRMIERHAIMEGDEQVARLTGGIVARKRRGLGRWLVVIPPELRGERS